MISVGEHRSLNAEGVPEEIPEEGRRLDAGEHRRMISKEHRIHHSLVSLAWEQEHGAGLREVRTIERT